MAFTQRILYEPIRSRDTSGASTYVTVGTPITHAASIVKMINLSDKDLLISVDGGVTDHDICPSGGFWLYDYTANSTINDNCFDPLGTQYYVKTTDGAAGTGLVYLIVQYIYQA